MKYIYADFSEKLDYFEAGVVRTKDGRVEVRGGNVRDPYSPSEVYVVPKVAEDEVSELVRGILQGMSAADRSCDVAFSYSRGSYDQELTTRFLSLRKKYNLKRASEQ